MYLTIEMVTMYKGVRHARGTKTSDGIGDIS